ncbi:ATPase, T2SS/T4P/T4SS family [Neobacillus pocheonensis]|uniref:ATPase, T2SS/T4P/T4SS family n=1 Tax=Neobacillus pocheonensis TaxID=363869 RepID=UPI003D2AABFE
MSESSTRIKRFNVSEFSKKQGLHHKQKKNEEGFSKNVRFVSNINTDRFDKVCSQFGEIMKKEFESRADTKEGNEIIDLELFAIIGKAENVTTILEKIETFLTNHKIRDVIIPEYYVDIHLFAIDEQRKYSNLTHAIFHELYGWNALACWIKYPESYAMQTIGNKIWIFNNDKGKFELMPFELKSENVIEKIIRGLETQKEHAKVNEQNPSLELDLYTGERVSILVKPRVIRPVITYRRVLTKGHSLQQLAIDKKLFDPVALPILIGISKTHCNTVIAGPMGTGKTTVLKGIVKEREDHITGISIEQDYEIGVSRDNPNKKFIEMVTRGTPFEDALEKALRTDADYGIIQEVRLYEAEGAMIMCEKLQKGFLSTTHLWRPETLPEQWARLICRYNKGSDQKAEEKRVAEYLDLVILLEQDEEKKKRLNSIQEIRYNRSNGEISTHQIMRFNEISEKYEFRCDLSGQLLREMRLINKKWADIVVETLQELENQFPIPEGEGVTIFNPAIADPQYRLALATEELVQAQQRTAEAMEKMFALMQTSVKEK